MCQFVVHILCYCMFIFIYVTFVLESDKFVFYHFEDIYQDKIVLSYFSFSN